VRVRDDALMQAAVKRSHSRHHGEATFGSRLYP
jgi:hypothetical protein